MANRRKRVPGGALPWPAGAQAVGLREPCPCGSGQRYKNCHGRSSHAQAGVPVPRPFAGVPFERDLVAFREFVPSAVARLPMVGAFAGRTVTLATLLPMAWPGIVRPDGEIWLGSQLQYPRQIDPARDLVATLRHAVTLEPGTPIEELPDWLDDDPALADIVEPGSLPEVEVRPGFDWWTEGAGELDAEVSASLERANEGVSPTAKIAGVEAAYWVRMGSRTYVRWVRDEPEAQLLDGLARLSVEGGLELGPAGRLIGSFRTCGLVVPVWELPDGTTAAEVADDAVAIDGALVSSLESKVPLTDSQRSARAAIDSRQVTLR